MTKQETEKLKGIFTRIAKESYSKLKVRFKNESDTKLKLETEYSGDFSIEERITKPNIPNIDESQKKDFISVISSLKDKEYKFTKSDIPRLDNFCVRLNYLLIGTSPSGKGMADQMNNIKDGAIREGNKLDIVMLFNEFKASQSWQEFEINTKISRSFLKKSDKWKLVYIFSNCKNCQDKSKYPLYYAAWQVIADWCFDIKYGNYDDFCEYYKRLDFLSDPKQLHFSNYYNCLRLSLKNDPEYIQFLKSLNDVKRTKILEELRENGEEDKGSEYNDELGSNENRDGITNKYFIIEINKLSTVFSQVNSGNDVDFKIEQDKSTNSEKITVGSIVLVKIEDKITYEFIAKDINGNVITLTKIFEIAKGADYTIESLGVFYELPKAEYDLICDKLFSDYNKGSQSKTNTIDINLKETFADWLFNSGKYSRVYDGDRAILVEKLNEFEIAYNTDFGISIFGYPSVSLDKIIEALETNIIEDTGKIGDLNRRTVDNGSVKAILGPNNYIKFLKELLLKISIVQIPFSYKTFHEKTKQAYIKFTEKLITRFIASLCTKPFVICSGLSGSGKTKLAQSFVQWISESKEQYAIIPVGADWTNREPLLGFPNGLEPLSYITPDSGALNLIINALKPENENKPYFLILDEMNLSHVERYFADFLSIMESKDEIKLYTGELRKNSEEIEINRQFSWPKNLFIIGTVNIDETTYMFSPKVLDRANVIEFRISDTEIAGYLEAPKDIEMNKFLQNIDSNLGFGASMAADFLRLAKKENLKNKIDANNTLVNFFKELQKAGSEFGYRSASEINSLIALLDILTEPDKKWDGIDIKKEHDFIDIAIMQKLLPKLHGSRNKLTPVLTTLGKFCVAGAVAKYDGKDKEKDFRTEYFETENFANVIYNVSFEKIKRMYKNAIANGFASYAEA